MADISKITLPSGSVYNLKDSKARDDIAALQGLVASGVSFAGTTTTTLTDGATTKPITVKGADYTQKQGDLVVYESSEFLWDGTKWILFGDLGTLKALAFKDSASGSFTPEGSVRVTIDQQIKKSTTVIAYTSVNPTYTPEGMITAPAIAAKTPGATTTISNPTKQTVAKSVDVSAPGSVAPDNNLTYYSVANENLSLYQIGFTTGDSITVDDVTVKTGDAVYEATEPTFLGTGVVLKTGDIDVPMSFNATFTGTAGTVNVS